MDEQIRNIQEARAAVKAALATCTIPQVQAMLRNADMELHWALWNLGVPVALRPEFE